MYTSRRAFLRWTGSGAAALALGGGMRTSSAAAQPPNILFLLTDDQRFDTIHALGNPNIQTPALDALAARGTAFTNAHIMGSTLPAVCVASRAMLLTGRPLFHLPASLLGPGSVPPAADSSPCVTFPEQFRAAGYHTFVTGKWHNGKESLTRGFAAGAAIFFGGMSDHSKMTVFDFDPSGEYPKGKAYTGGAFSSELFSDSAVRFLRDYDGDAPFLAYVAYSAPHDPRTPPGDYAGRYAPDSLPLPSNFLPEHPFDNGELRIRDEELAPWPRTPETVRGHLAAYYGMISHLDAQVGRVLEALEASGRAGNTIIVFASDNGLAIGSHGLLGKQNLYEHSVRVPLILCGPGIPRGEQRDALWYLSDVFPALSGLVDPAAPEGASAASAFTGAGAQGRELLFFAYRDVQRAVRTGRWKFIRYIVGGRRTAQLFDLEADPGECVNLAGEPAHAERVAEMHALLRRAMRKADDPCYDAWYRA